ncbi:hypothetical protein V6N11_005003 [Hibiscus sabdariffa]|uniref:Uncharacterized protein n=1 Tax=Hibiscus sabdariffa TaxID=183260 RepID=A0ABR2NHH7_9ROSI
MEEAASNNHHHLHPIGLFQAPIPVSSSSEESPGSIPFPPHGGLVAYVKDGFMPFNFLESFPKLNQAQVSKPPSPSKFPNVALFLQEPTMLNPTTLAIGEKGEPGPNLSQLGQIQSQTGDGWLRMNQSLTEHSTQIAKSASTGFVVISFITTWKAVQRGKAKTSGKMGCRDTAPEKPKKGLAKDFQQCRRSGYGI